MTEPTITCPKCKAEIKLTESFAEPLIEGLRKDYDKRIAQKDSEIKNRESAIQEREASLLKEKEINV